MDFEIEDEDPYDFTAEWGTKGGKKKGGFSAFGEENSQDEYDFDLGDAVVG